MAGWSDIVETLVELQLVIPAFDNRIHRKLRDVCATQLVWSGTLLAYRAVLVRDKPSIQPPLPVGPFTRLAGTRALSVRKAFFLEASPSTLIESLRNQFRVGSESCFCHAIHDKCAPALCCRPRHALDYHALLLCPPRHRN